MNYCKAAALLLLWMLLSSCGENPSEAADVQYFRLASNQSENYVTNQACQMFCELVEKRSAGELIIRPFFNGELGDDSSALKQCADGGVDFARVTAASAAECAPMFTALQMPYEYTSDKHLFRVLDGEIGKEALDSLTNSNLVGLSYFYAGYRCFFTTQYPLDALEDMRGLKLRTGASAEMDNLIGQWDAVGVSLPKNDLALALRTGVVDGAEDNLPTYVDGGYYRLAPYWTYDRHTYTADVLVISQDVWNQFSNKEQEIIRECSAEAAVWQRSHWIDAEVRAMLHASRSGCYMALLNEVETERFRQAAQPLYEKLTQEQREIVKEIGALADIEE